MPKTLRLGQLQDGSPIKISKKALKLSERYYLAQSAMRLTAVWCGYYEGNLKSKRVQEKLGFLYHHTCNEVPVPLLNEIRIGHTNYMTKEQWLKNQAHSLKQI